MLASPISNSKMNFYILLGLIVTVSQFSISSSEPVSSYSCGDAGSGAKDPCMIENVAIEPCPEALENKTCTACRGSNMSISFDWYPPFSAENFTSQIHSTVLFFDIPDVDHSSPGCQYTKCPIVAGEKHTFQSTCYVKPFYPAGQYLVKYKLWHESSKKECCFCLEVNIV